jgi:AbrB family transcriptional regulator, transcriptional pleiotropic regulator of transition state genes
METVIIWYYWYNGTNYIYLGDTGNMKSTGIVRKVDQLGRAVIPIELRKVLAIKEKDPVEIFVEGNHIIFKKYRPYNECIITGEVTPRNREYANGVVLSPRGAEILKHEIEFRFGIKA